MDLPVKFPAETEVILDDVARFRALTPKERIQTIRSMLADGAVPSEQIPERRLGQAVFRRTRTACPTEHPGVHCTTCTLTPCRQEQPCPRHVPPRRADFPGPGPRWPCS